MFRHLWPGTPLSGTIVLTRPWQPPTYCETSIALIVANEGFMESSRPPSEADTVGTVSGGHYGFWNSHLVGSIVDGRHQRCCLQIE